MARWMIRSTKYVPELASAQSARLMKDGKPVMKGGKPVLADPKSKPTMRQLMSHYRRLRLWPVLRRSEGRDLNADRLPRHGRARSSKNLEEMIGKIEAIPLIYDPGTSWSYSASVDIQGYHRPEALGPEVRRLPEGQHASRRSA